MLPRAKILGFGQSGISGLFQSLDWQRERPRSGCIR